MGNQSSPHPVPVPVIAQGGHVHPIYMDWRVGRWIDSWMGGWVGGWVAGPAEE